MPILMGGRPTPINLPPPINFWSSQLQYEKHEEEEENQNDDQDILPDLQRKMSDLGCCSFDQSEYDFDYEHESFHCKGSSNVALDQDEFNFMQSTSSNVETARHYLRLAAFDLQRAIDLFYKSGGHEVASESSNNKKKKKPQKGSPKSPTKKNHNAPFVGSVMMGTGGPGNNAEFDGSTHIIANRNLSRKELILTLATTNDNDNSMLHPALQRRVRDFHFAQWKRREKYGRQKSRRGIFGLYQHLAEIRVDLEWAEDAAWRRIHNEPYERWEDYEMRYSSGMNNPPVFTYMTIVICTGVLITTIGMNGWILEPFDVNPLLGPSAEVLIRAGARETSLIVVEHQWYRLFTPIILHAGIIHWLLNMIALYFVGGEAIEKSHGFMAAAILFIIPAVGGNILSAIFLPQYIGVGASGGIFGLIGACIADIIINWNILFIKSGQEYLHRSTRNCGALVWLLLDIVIMCVLGLTPYVDNFTHLGGLFYGVCCGLTTLDRIGFGFVGDFFHSSQGDRRCGNSEGRSPAASFGKRWSNIRINLLSYYGLFFSVCLIVLTTALLVNSDGHVSPCSACRYLSCVPFPFWLDSSERWWNCDDCEFVTASLIKMSPEYYDQIDLTCPDGNITSIDITDDEEADRDMLVKKLPSYCRLYCDDVYVSSSSSGPSN